MLHNKSVVVTGANRGIGRCLLELFAKNGANIWACARKENAAFECDLRELSSKYGVWLKPVYFDLADSESISVGLQGVLDDKRPIDVLVNCAGKNTKSLLVGTNFDEMRSVFEVNFFSQMHIIRRLVKFMIRKKSGSIINVASIRGIVPQAGRFVYSSSKAALIMATQCLAKELAPFNIRVNVIAPGAVDTEMIGIHSDDIMNDYIDAVPLKRLAKPVEIAEAILFFASDKSSYITGQVLRVDGGY